MPTLFAETEFNSLKSFILLLIIFIPLSSYGSTNSVTDLEDELSTAVQNDDSVAIQRLTKDPLLAESIYAVRIQAHAYDEGAFGFNVDKNLALELYLKAKSMGDSISALSAGLLYHQEGNSFHDPDLGNQLIVEAASMGNESAQRLAAMCYLDNECHNSLNFDETHGWFSDDSVYFHPKANATLKAALSLPAMKNKLDYSYSILSSYSERFEEDEGYDGTYTYFPASLANNLSFEQFEYWLEIGIAEKHAQAALSLSALCYLETGICSDKIRAKSLGELAVSWSPDLLSNMGMFVDMVEPDSSLDSLYQAFGVQLTKAIGGDL